MKPAGYVLLALAAVLGAGTWLATRPDTPPALEVLWQQRWPDAGNRPQAFAQWRGRPLVVNFWASWCPPCREEMPDFDRLRREYRAHGVEFVGVAIDTPENVAAFLQENPVSYPILIGGGAGNTISRELGGNGLPHTLVIATDGKIALNHLGRLSAAQLGTALRGVAN